MREVKQDRQDSTYFAVLDIEGAQSLGTASHGDLWPSTWADDGNLYTACGDGHGFCLTEPWSDIVVNRVEGMPATGLVGTRLASGKDVAPVWTDPGRFNRKPTGIVAVDGNGDGHDELYLAVQDLPFPDATSAFDEAPAAGVVRSDDYGRTWRSPPGPMFTNHVFTTVMFLDLGQSNTHSHRVDSQATTHVYAYGLDHNWRTSYSGCVPDPEDLFLARVPADAIQDRGSWEFFAGCGPARRPRWTSRIDARVPVLTDTRRRHADLLVDGPRAGSLIAQGGIVYDAPLDRYLYSSWTEYTFELFEAPQAWGPWRHALSRDFGPFPWVGPKGPLAAHGGYGTTIPSKFISEDGRGAWLQSNWFSRASTYSGRTYHFSLRRVRLDPATTESAPQPPSDQNLAAPDCGAWAVATACRNNQLAVLNDGRSDLAEDSWNGTPKSEDHWGYTWSASLRMNRLVYVSGPYDTTAGWFGTAPRVQVRRHGQWLDARDQSVSPPYEPGPDATGSRRYTFTFAEVVTDGVRLIGQPGGHEAYTAIAELGVYHDR